MVINKDLKRILTPKEKKKKMKKIFPDTAVFSSFFLRVMDSALVFITQ